MSQFDFVILGGGIAGLTAAHELTKQGASVLLIEKNRQVGGLARTIEHEGYRFDIGGHRFHSNNPEVVGWVKELLDADLLTVPRLSHIYLNGRFARYPLDFPNALNIYSIPQAIKMIGSYLWARTTNKNKVDVSFEDWVVKRFGWAIYSRFFQPYTEKVWGIPCDELSADWAAQRIGLPTLWQTVRNTLNPNHQPPPTAITQFYYPRFGFGQISQHLSENILINGGQILTNTIPRQISPTQDGFNISMQSPDSEIEQQVHAAELISTIPLNILLDLLPSSSHRNEHLSSDWLSYRSLICVFFAIRKKQISQDSWTYFPEKNFTFGRTHEPKNWSDDMVPDPGMSSLCAEIFTDPDHLLWKMPDEELSTKLTAEFSQLGWFTHKDVYKSWVIRVPFAYPIYKVGYHERLAAAKRYLSQWPQLHLIGRTGAFHYMNSDGVIEDVCAFLARRTHSPHHIKYSTADGRWV